MISELETVGRAISDTRFSRKSERVEHVRATRVQGTIRGKDLIRHVAAQHKFFVYRKTTGLVKSEVDSIRAGLADITNVYEHDQPVMMLSAGAGVGGRVNIGGISDTGEAAARDDTRPMSRRCGLHRARNSWSGTKAPIVLGEWNDDERDPTQRIRPPSTGSSNACALRRTEQWVWVLRRWITTSCLRWKHGEVTVAKLNRRRARADDDTGRSIRARRIDQVRWVRARVQNTQRFNGFILGSNDAGTEANSSSFGKCGVGTDDCIELHL